MACRPGASANPGRRPGAVPPPRRPQQSITSLFKRATPEEQQLRGGGAQGRIGRSSRQRAPQTGAGAPAQSCCKLRAATQAAQAPACGAPASRRQIGGSPRSSCRSCGRPGPEVALRHLASAFLLLQQPPLAHALLHAPEARPTLTALLPHLISHLTVPPHCQTSTLPTLHWPTACYQPPCAGFANLYDP
jgi:hypothetical protein